MASEDFGVPPSPKDRQLKGEGVSETDSLDARDIASKTVHGSAFNVIASGITMISGLLRSVFLARLLTPEDFGVMALALIFLSFAGQISDFGFGKALIHRDTEIEKAASTHFILRTSLSILTAMIVIMVSIVMNRLYSLEPHMTKTLVILSFFHILSALNSTPQIMLRKELDFRFLATLNVLTSLSMTFGAVTMALVGLGFWSLVAEQAIAVLVRVVGLWIFKRPWEPTFQLDRPIIRWYFRFGAFAFFSSVLAKLLDQFDDFWIGTVLGSANLGFYSRAYEFAGYPQRVLGSPITSVLFPTYAKLQHDRLRLSQAFFRVSSLLIRIGFLLSLILILVIPEFVHLFLGDIWLPMVFPFRLMVLYTLLDPLATTCGQLLTAIGQPKLLTRIKVLQLAIFIPAVIILANLFGINGVAIAADLMMAIGLGFMIGQVREFIDFSLPRLLCYPLLGFVAGGSAALLISPQIPTQSDWLSLLTKGAIAAIIYSGVLLLVEHHEYIKSFKLIYNYTIHKHKK